MVWGSFAHARRRGEGGTIPFMGMLGERFPKAQFLITGLLGPKSNAHGPNEFLHIETGKRLGFRSFQYDITDHDAFLRSLESPAG